MLDAKISKTILISLKNQSAQVQVSHENRSMLLKATSLHVTVGHLVKQDTESFSIPSKRPHMQKTTK